MADFIPLEAPAREAQALPVMLYGKPVGRDEALKTIYTHLKANRAVLIHGPAGMGKTALASTLAGAYAQQPGGVLWLNVNDSPLEELIVRVGRAYGVQEITGSDQPLGMIGAVASTLTQNKPLVVLDGKISSQAAMNFVNKCATGLPTMIVSEEEIEGPWTGIVIGRLDPDNAAIFFKQQAALTDTSQDINVFGLGKVLEHTPFALAIAARAMVASKQTPNNYLPAMQQVAGTTGGNGMLAALTTAYKTLTGPLQGLILMIGATFAGRASLELLSMLSGASSDSVQQAMNVLTQLYLVERTQRYGTPYYSLHNLTHAFAQNILKTSNRLEGLQTKVRDTVLAYAKKYSAADVPSHNKLATEMEAFLAVSAWASEQGEREAANQLVMALTQAGDFVSSRGYLYELLKLRGAGTGFATAFPAYAGDVPAERYQMDEIDEEFDDEAFEEEFDEEFEEEDEETFEDELEDLVEEAMGEDEDEFDEDEDFGEGAVTDEIAKLRAALGQARQSGDTTKQVELLKSIGKEQVAKKMDNEAIATYTEALNLYETADDTPGILEMLDMLSSLMAKTENSQAAVLHATRGIRIAQELNDDETRMQLSITLGDARQQLGESQEAENSYRQALEIARTTGDTQNEAIILFKLGYAQLDNGEPKAAIETWEEALALFKEQKKRDYEGRVLGALGSAYGELERWSEAISFHTSALYIAREVKDAEEEALQLGNLGYASVQYNQLGQALLRYRQALHLYYQSHDRENIVSTIVDLVRLLVQSQRHLSVAELLIDDALRLEPHDRELNSLKERINNEKMLAQANGVEFVEIAGTAQDYAANAHKLLDQ
jgi:tetratricopeptide (TPR) repeat protein